MGDPISLAIGGAIFSGIGTIGSFVSGQKQAEAAKKQAQLQEQQIAEQKKQAQEQRKEKIDQQRQQMQAGGYKTLSTNPYGIKGSINSDDDVLG